VTAWVEASSPFDTSARARLAKGARNMKRTKAVVGLGLAAALGATGITVALAEGSDPAEAGPATELAAARAEALPDAQRDAWLTQVADYVEHEAARKYAIAVFARLADWHAVEEYAEALAAAQPSVSGSSTLASIRACESGGDYGAVSSSGTYRGAYQFDQATWESVGGSGDPAAASPAEQDMRAQMLYEQSGSSPWPVCGS
jgi:hypothetical protein